MVDTTKYKVIGTRPIRHDGADKVTGRAIYTDDFQLPGMLHGQIVRCPFPHARIQSIDTSAAEQHPGVFAVVTAADFPDLSDKIANLGEGAVNLVHLASNVLAQKKALYRGHAVAAVAANSRHVAQEAAALIKVEYEQLPSVTSIEDAMRDDAPLLHENLVTDSPLGENSEKPSNVATHLHFEKGDVAQGFAEADVIVEREFQTASVHQGYIEPHVSIALWNEDDRVKIWTATQGSFVPSAPPRPTSHVRAASSPSRGAVTRHFIRFHWRH